MTPEHPSDPPIQTIQLARGTASFTDEGEGPALVAIHGLPGTVRDFRWLAAALPPSVRLIRLNLPGFGATDRSCAKGTSLAARGAFVREMLEALSIERCAVMGHSMGGPVAMQVAARYPGRVNGLVLLASVGARPHRAYRKSPSFGRLSRALRIPGVPLLLKRSIHRAYTKLGFPSSTPYTAMVQSLHYVAGLDFGHVQDNLQRLTVPTFVSWTTDDHFIEEDIAVELADACPQGPRLLFSEGGHNLQKTQAIEIAHSLASWLPTLV